MAFLVLSVQRPFGPLENLSKPLKTGSKSWKFAIEPKAKKAFSFEIDVLNLFWTILVYLTCFLDQFSLESGFVCQVRISVNRENDIWYKRGNSRKFVQNPQNLFSSTFPRFDLNRQSKHSQFSSTSQLSLKTVSVLGAVLPCRMGSNSNFPSTFLSNFLSTFPMFSIVFQLTVVWALIWSVFVCVVSTQSVYNFQLHSVSLTSQVVHPGKGRKVGQVV